MFENKKLEGKTMAEMGQEEFSVPEIKSVVMGIRVTII